MKLREQIAYGEMFEIAERNFNAPSPVIAFPDIVQCKWEGKVGNEILICILSGFDLNNAKLQEIKMTVVFPKKLIKMRGIFTGIDVAVNIWLAFHNICGFIRKKALYRNVEFFKIIRKLRCIIRKNAFWGRWWFYTKNVPPESSSSNV